MRSLVLGAGGFIGSHMVEQLRKDGHFVRAADLKYPEFSESAANEFLQGDLRSQDFVNSLIDEKFDRIFQFAADMGGAGFVFVGTNDAEILQNSARINLNVLDAVAKTGVGKILFASSACIYPQENQRDPETLTTSEDTAYPANPDSEYGWEKLFSERLYLTYARNYNLDVRISRYHNIFGPKGTWRGGREKAPAALCRKVAEAEDGETIDVWGDGHQTRSFLYIDECIEGTLRLVRSNCRTPLNIGSDEMLSINDLANRIIGLSGKRLALRHIEGPLGVRGRNSNNHRIQQELGWKPSHPLIEGLGKTYQWINSQVAAGRGTVSSDPLHRTFNSSVA